MSLNRGATFFAFKKRHLDRMNVNSNLEFELKKNYLFYKITFHQNKQKPSNDECNFRIYAL